MPKAALASARKRERVARVHETLLPTSTRFNREQRLTTSAQFGWVFAGAARSADSYFTVLGRPGPTHIARLGLTISRRAAKRAVDRNKLKRLARESFRHQRLPPWDFIVMSKPGAAKADKRTLRHSLDAHFKRLTARASSGNG